MRTFKRRVCSEQEMQALGVELAREELSGVTVYLHGQLGAGKTAFVRGLLHGCGHQGAVKSPTYTLVEEYALPQFVVYHFDLYRLSDAEELYFMGIEEYFGPDSVRCIEWPEKGKGVLPPADIEINVAVLESNEREVEIRACSEIGERVVTDM